MTDTQPKTVLVDAKNLKQQGCRCFLNPKHEAHLEKLEWVQSQLPKGILIKNLWHPVEKKPIGFIEAIPGESAWRAVDAKDYLFIQCIWISPNKYKVQGYGSQLIQECIEDAKKQGKKGVAVITSEGTFMAKKPLFLKNGFEVIEISDRFELLAIKFGKVENPKFRDWQSVLQKITGFQIFYSEQCPWVIRTMKEITAFLQEHQILCKITKYETPQQAQSAPSIYGTLVMVKDGKILTDHYISFTRFQTILKKEKIG